jgi:hypothetical protein
MFFNFKLPELLIIGSTVLFVVGINSVAWVFFSLSLFGVFFRLAWDNHLRSETEKKIHDAVASLKKKSGKKVPDDSVANAFNNILHFIEASTKDDDDTRH